MSQPIYPQSPPPQPPYTPGGPPPGHDGTAQKRSNTTLVVVIIAVVVVGGLLVIGTFGTFAYYGFRRYVARSKAVEGRVTVEALARGIVRCAAAEDIGVGVDVGVKGLPPTSPKVPPSLSQVKGTKYMSTPSDWSADAFTCARFSVSLPQVFQYQWVLTTPGRKGVVRAEADFDGDGAVDASVEQDVECTDSGAGLRCSTGAVRETL